MTAALTTAQARVSAISLYQVLLWSQLLLFLALMVGCWSLLSPWLDRPLERVAVTGELRETEAPALEKQVWQLNDASFAEVDLKGLKQALEQQPWVHQVDVRRQWPAGLKVSVREEHPVARWSDQGLLNEQGAIFWPNGIGGYEHLPVLQGPTEKPLELMAQYRSMSQLVRPLDLKLTALEMEPRGAWAVTLDNGIRLQVGRGQVIEKINRFKRVYGKQLTRYADKIKQIDLRYTNGLTVTWNQPPNV